ncbi:7235_t:CDS:2 [Acaulospora morrowiae]|uniref:7235_t:CDS:1 n=1 Tax=Acaulospora morrowiae TaxID=94023 RepID=A0A9N8Z7J2_9GLOM|nr:7235_t:CDS:2 [Acaulospora morrowiae]
MSNRIGPQIPAYLLSNFKENPSDEDNDDFESSPDTSPKLFTEQGGNLTEEEGNLDDYMPELPPDIIAERQRKKIEQENNLNKGDLDKRKIGPAMPPFVGYDEHQTSEEEEDIVGPILPRDFNEKNDELAFQSAIQEFEERADKMRQKLESGEEGENRLQRGEWMLVPPPEAKFLEEEEIKYTEADLENAKRVKEYNELYRPKSLLEEHAEKYTKSKKWKEDSVSNRPFEREKDVLGARRMDSRKRQEILDNAKELSSKVTIIKILLA